MLNLRGTKVCTNKCQFVRTDEICVSVDMPILQRMLTVDNLAAQTSQHAFQHSSEELLYQRAGIVLNCQPRSACLWPCRSQEPPSRAFSPRTWVCSLHSWYLERSKLPQVYYHFCYVKYIYSSRATAASNLSHWWCVDVATYLFWADSSSNTQWPPTQSVATLRGLLRGLFT